MAESPPPFHCGEQRAASGHQRAATAAGLLQVLPEVHAPGASIADIGCGDGKFASALRACSILAPWCGYDLHPQLPAVVAFDVRSDALPRPHTVAVMLGVIAACGRLLRDVVLLRRRDCCLDSAR